MLRVTDKQEAQLYNFRTCFIEYPEITEIYSIFDRMRLNKSLGGEQESLLLTGETGSGKTALINNYLSKHQTITSSTFAYQPILNTRIPPKVNELSTMLQLLKDLNTQTGSRAQRNRNELALAESVVVQLKRKKTELIILNEVQELIEFSSVKDRQAIANTLKYISEEAQVSFVLVGMPYSELLAEEPQWNSRLSWRRELRYFQLSKNKAHFIKVIKGLANRMGFSEPPELHKKEIAIALFSICRGEFRLLKHFLEDAMLTCFLAGRTTVDLDVLAETYQLKYAQTASNLNPFLNPEGIKISELSASTKFNPYALKEEDKIISRRFTDALPLNLLLSKSGLKM